jgi:HSP20 family protein
MKESFLQKIKKGMGIEIGKDMHEEAEEKVKTKPAPKASKRTKPTQVEPEPKKSEEPTSKEADMEAKLKEDIEKLSKSAPQPKKSTPEWSSDAEGQLAIDVYQTDDDLVVQSAIAGVKAEDLDILIEDDLVTIRGKRAKPEQEQGDYFSQECYWGPFSRQIILPVEVDPGRAEATLKLGILTVRIPKISREKKRKLIVKG